MNTTEIAPILECPGVTWGVRSHGASLSVNSLHYSAYVENTPLVIDVETDEKDGFVGMAVSVLGSKDVAYFTQLTDALKDLLSNSPLIGHNLKGDAHWLKNWGVSITSDQILHDTMIMSYVVNPTKESHGLKNLAREFLGWEWPTYTQLVGKGRKRVTLDKQPVELVSEYCGMDCFTTSNLCLYLLARMGDNYRRIYNTIEMPINRLLFKIEEEGVRIDTAYLKTLDAEFSEKLQNLLVSIKTLTTPQIEKMIVDYSVGNLKEKWEQSAFKALEKSRAFNPGSWQQKRLLLKYMDIIVPSTGKGILAKYKGNALIDLLLKHSEIAKLYNAFIGPMSEQYHVGNDVVHTTYSQVSEDSSEDDLFRGLKTGRLSSKRPNLQQIPVRTEDGKKLRGLFIPRPGFTLIVTDYNSIELRVLAHFSGEPLLVNAFKQGKDIHQETADLLGVDRFWGKTANFLLAFGGSEYRLASTLEITVDEARKFHDLFWSKFKTLHRWIKNARWDARQRGGAKTILGRFIPLRGFNDMDYKVRGRLERLAISCIIQGSAADILKMSMLECDKAGYFPILTVHDELVFEAKDDVIDIETSIVDIKKIMESVAVLNVPLVVEAGHGKSWGEAKEGA